MKFRSLSIRVLFIFLMAVSLQSSIYARPVLSFFCELESEEFKTLLARPGIKELLREMRAELRIGIHDFSSERAAAIQELNQWGIPVYSWIQAHDNQGYTFTVRNASSLKKRYESFKAWTEEYQLKWEGIGVDLRPGPEVMQGWVEQPLISSWNSYLNLFKQEEHELASKFFKDFKAQVKKDGFVLESYVLPFSIDEMLGDSKGYQYMGQTVNLKSDKIIPLCLTSFPYISPASILEYGKRVQGVAIGSVSPQQLGNRLETNALTWEELSRDLRLAHDVSQEIHLFNLESIVANGWLEAIAEFDFSIPVFLYSKELSDQETTSFVAQKAFQALSYPILSSIISVILLILLVLCTYFLLRYFLTWKKTQVRTHTEEMEYEIISTA